MGLNFGLTGKRISIMVRCVYGARGRIKGDIEARAGPQRPVLTQIEGRVSLSVRGAVRLDDCAGKY